MSAQTIIANAAAAEKRTREMAQVFHATAKANPKVQTLQILAEAVDLMLQNAETRAGLIDAKDVERRRAEFDEQAIEIEEQLLEGTRTKHDAIADLDRIKAGLDVWLAQPRLDAWEWAEAEMRSILAMGGRSHGT